MKSPQLPFPKLSAALGIPNEVWLKREDLHKYGSPKGRSIPLMIDEYCKQGITNFVISSSGNAALAAAQYVETKNKSKPHEPLTLHILVGEKIGSDKLKILHNTVHDSHITIQQVHNPKQTTFQMEKDSKGKWLRQSTDDTALAGYHELAKELAKIPNLAVVFIPTSSGTTAQGLHEGFQELSLNPQIHIVQTTACHPIAQELQATSYPPDSPDSPTAKPWRAGKLQATHSLATAIVDRIAFRKEKVIAAIKNSRGGGWIATDEEIGGAIKLVKESTGIEISPNSALSVVGLQQAIQAEWRWEGAVVCLVTGR